MDKSNLFISYSWLNTDIADEIDNKFQSIGITFMRDVRDVGDFQSLSDFMKKIRNNDYVIMIISNSYLKSVNCMFEVLEFMKEKSFKNRILPIIDKDEIDIFSTEGKIFYIDYWQNEFEYLKNKISKLEPMNATKLLEKLKFVERICREIEEFLFILSDMKLKTIEELKQMDYKPILKLIGYEKNASVSELLTVSMINDVEERNLEEEKYKTKYGETSMFYHYKGYRANEDKNHKLARYYYEKALGINPQYVISHNNLAALLTQGSFNDYEGARKHYEKALEINPNYSEAHNNFALLLKTDNYKDYEGARKHYEDALEINPNYAKAHNNLAGLLIEHFKDYENARMHIEKSLDIDPNNIEAHFNYAILLETKHYNDYEGARKHYEKTLDINPQCAIAYNNLACLLSEHFNDYKGARKYFEKALNINPNFAEAHYNFARLLTTKYYKDYEGARKHFEVAVDINPQYANTQYNLGIVKIVKFKGNKKDLFINK